MFDARVECRGNYCSAIVDVGGGAETSALVSYFLRKMEEKVAPLCRGHMTKIEVDAYGVQGVIRCLAKRKDYRIGDFFHRALFKLSHTELGNVVASASIADCKRLVEG